MSCGERTLLKAQIKDSDSSFRDTSLGIAEDEAMIGVSSELITSVFDGCNTLLCCFIVACPCSF